MKKWKQLVVFVMILTMVMGMTSFAAPGDARSTGSSVTNPNQPEETVTSPSLSNNKLTIVENPTLPNEGDNVKLKEVLGLDIKKSEVDLNETTTEGKALNRALAALSAEGFGAKSDTDEKDQMKIGRAHV